MGREIDQNSLTSGLKGLGSRLASRSPAYAVALESGHAICHATHARETSFRIALDILEDAMISCYSLRGFENFFQLLSKTFFNQFPAQIRGSYSKKVSGF